MCSLRSLRSLALNARSLSIIVTKILRKIRATTFTERLRKITREGEGLGEQRRFQLVLVALPFTRSLPTRIQWVTRHKPLNVCFEMAIRDFSC